MEQIKIIEIDMPISVKGFVQKTFDNGEFYTICINSQLSNEKKYFTIKHELEHISKDDFSKFASIDILERERHL